MAKLRLNRMTNGYKEEELDTKTQEVNDIEDAKDRMTFNYETLTIDLGRKRPTDCTNNRRTILPKARTTIKEAELTVRREGWVKIINEYASKNCRENGKQKVENITKDEKVGMHSIIKKVKAGKL